MNVNRKTLIFVISGTAAVVLIALAVLWYVNRPNKTTTVKNLFGILPQVGEHGGGGGSTTGGQQPTPENQQPIPNEQQPATGGGETPEAELLQIVKKPILGATLTADGTKIIYYARSGGKLETVDFSGETLEQVSPLTIVGMFDVVWQKAKRRSIVSYQEGGGAVKRFINTTATTGVMFLPDGARAFDFSPDSRQMAYLLPKNGVTQLVIATEDGKNPRVVLETPIPDFSLSWIARAKILLQSAPSQQAPGIAYVFDTGTKALEKILGNIRANTTIASPDGNILLTSFAGNGGGIVLSLTNQKGENGKIITASTIAEKCVFTKDAKALYCAVSDGGTDLPDAWFRGDTAPQDQFVRIPLDTRVVETISDKTKFDAIHLFLSPDGQYLFFQDKNDLTLWRMKLSHR